MTLSLKIDNGCGNSKRSPKFCLVCENKELDKIKVYIFFYLTPSNKQLNFTYEYTNIQKPFGRKSRGNLILKEMGKKSLGESLHELQFIER